MSQPEHELKAVEAALAGLVPSAGGFDRDCVLFRAGQNAAPRRPLWPCVSAALALLSIGLGAALLMGPEPVVVERIVYLPALVTPEPEPPDVAAAEPSWPGKPRYYQIRDELLARGLDALPQPPPLQPGPPPPAHPLLRPRGY